jgi:2-oxo-3-hexenedioate decarboxylase
MELEALASELWSARAARSYVEPPSARGADFAMGDAYAVAALMHDEAVRRGWTPVGAKLGFTNEAAWSALGIDRPFWSTMYAETVVEGPDVSLAPFVAPRLEPEIVVATGAELRRGARRDEVVGALAWAALGFEVVQSHYPDWLMQPVDAVADAGLHGVLVVGEHQALGPSEADALARVEVEVVRDGAQMATGTGANALGGPVDALVWLMTLPGVEVLQAGAVVTTGSLTGAFEVRGGEGWRLRASGSVALPELSVRFAADGG